MLVSLFAATARSPTLAGAVPPRSADAFEPAGPRASAPEQAVPATAAIVTSSVARRIRRREVRPTADAPGRTGLVGVRSGPVDVVS